jgi:hypothetical protein
MLKLKKLANNLDYLTKTQNLELLLVKNSSKYKLARLEEAFK